MKAEEKNTRASSPPIGLQIVGTPIGNLEDITLRALRILRESDLIAAEDTRRTRKLLSHYDIHTPIVSYHEHNKQTVTSKLIARLKDGQVIALVTDAGMPGISDPGHDLIVRALAEAIPIGIVPGPSSITSALVISGLPTAAFHFEGFLPRKKAERLRRIEALLAREATTVLFESPTRIAALLEQIARLAADRQIVVARELTKKFEEVVRATASDAAAYFGRKTPRGEFVVVLEGVGKHIAYSAPPASRDDVAELVAILTREEGLAKKDAMRKVAQQLNISRREVYRKLLEERSPEE